MKLYGIYIILRDEFYWPMEYLEIKKISKLAIAKKQTKKKQKKNKKKQQQQQQKKKKKKKHTQKNTYIRMFIPLKGFSYTISVTFSTEPFLLVNFKVSFARQVI